MSSKLVDSFNKQPRIGMIGTAGLTPRTPWSPLDDKNRIGEDALLLRWGGPTLPVLTTDQ